MLREGERSGVAGSIKKEEATRDESERRLNELRGEARARALTPLRKQKKGSYVMGKNSGGTQSKVKIMYDHYHLMSNDRSHSCDIEEGRHFRENSDAARKRGVGYPEGDPLRKKRG